MNSKIKTNIKSVGGTAFAAGETVTCTFDGSSKVKIMAADGRTMNVRLQTAEKYLTGFRKCPTLPTLEKYSSNGVCPTPTGARVEPDGHDPHGCPSWLLVLGYI